MFKFPPFLLKKVAFSTSVIASGGTGSVVTYLLTKQNEKPIEEIEESQIAKDYATLKSDFKRATQRIRQISRMAESRRIYMNALKSREECLTKNKVDNCPAAPAEVD